MDKTQPFFSIVIPTKNRHDLLHDSIFSALNQNFDDFEVIVSDNWNDEKTKQTVDSFLPNSKLKYVRPEQELNMLNHWEFASKHATGKWVILLPDRKILYQGALQYLYEKINIYPQINCLSFRITSYNEKTNLFYTERPKTADCIVKTKDLIANFLNTNYFSPDSLDMQYPKTLNGAFKNEFAQLVRSKTGHYFNTPGVTTPDYSSFFYNALLNDESLYIDKRLGIAQGEEKSNGRLFGNGNITKYLSMLNLTEEALYESLVPIRQAFIYNWLIIDYLKIQRILQLSNTPINEINYFKTIYTELNNKLKSNLMNDVQKKEFEDSFYNALAKTNLTKTEVCVLPTKKQNNKITIYNYKNHLRDYVLHNFPTNKILNNLFVKRGKNILYAAHFYN